MSRVLVTGAGGFVGSHLALGLTRLGLEVVATDRAFDVAATARSGGLERLLGDLREVTFSGRFDYLIHGAALTASPEELGVSEAAYLAENLELTLSALKLAQTHGVERFVFLSSAGVFSTAQVASLDETVLPDSLGLYAAAKRTGELAAQSLRAAGALDAVSVRLGNLYGPDERPRTTRPRVGLVARLLGEAETAGTLTVPTPSALREWTHVQDLAPVVARLLERPDLPDVTHLCAPDVLTDRHLAEKLQRLLPGVKLELPSTPASPVRPPLRTCFTETLGLNHWTPLDAGLAELVRKGVPA